MMIEEQFERWLTPQLGRVHAELQGRYGLEQDREQGAQEAAARASNERQPPVAMIEGAGETKQ
jgi:hypothetical protein